MLWQPAIVAAQKIGRILRKTVLLNILSIRPFFSYITLEWSGVVNRESEQGSFNVVTVSAPANGSSKPL